MKAYVCLLLSISLWFGHLQAQVVQSVDTLLGNGTMMMFQNNSLTDFENYRKLKANYFPYGGPDYTNFYSAYLSPRESIDTLSFSNEGNSDITDFYFFLNDNKVMNLDSLVHQLFSSCTTEREKAQAVYRYVKDHHLYYYAVDKADPIRENYDAAKMLNVYGIGNCGMIANTAAQLSALYTGNDQRHWYVSNGDHGIAEVRFDSTYINVDADQEGLYLLPDNKTLASFYDVYLDSHHYLRSKHFSTAVPFDYDWNIHFNESYRVGGHYINHTDTVQNINEPCCPKLNGRLGENLHFTLKPKSTISYIPNDTLFTNHFVHTQPAPSITTVLLNLGKGLIKTDFSAIGSQPYPSLSAFNNLSADPMDSAYIPSAIQQQASLVFKEQSPYAISTATLQFRYILNSPADSLLWFFSKDSVNWTPINWAKQYGSTYQDATLSLLNLIQPNSTKATYYYFLKCILYQSGGPGSARMSIPQLTSQFQYNKLTGPQIKRGTNTLRIFSSPTNQLRCRIRWNENQVNHAPQNVIQPVFPTNNMVCDSTSFTFRWTVPTDPDGDSIVDYQIQVSAHSDMRYPLSTLFDRYMLLTNSGKPFFTPEVNDYFNHQTPYYWRVRAQDNKGAWSEWSSNFSFQVKTPMYPRNLHWEIVADSIRDVIRLAWDKNQDGDSVAYYKVMGSGNILGFEASDSKLFGNTLSEDILVHFPTGRKRYRVRAIGAHNNQSASSYFINLPVSKTLLLGSTFNYMDTFANNLNAKVQPFPPVNMESRPVFYVADPNKIQINGNLLTAIDTGRTMVDLCTRINQDTIRLMTAFVRIVAAFPAPANKPTLLVWAKDTSSIYGNAIITNGVRYAGFLNGHDSNILNTKPNIQTSANQTSAVGLYDVLPGNASSPLYDILYQAGILEIKQRNLTLKANDTILSYGSVCSTYNYSAIGLVNNDSLSMLLETPLLSTNYTPTSLPAAYAISISGGRAKNYLINNYIPGQITVQKAMLSASPAPIVSTYGDQPQAGTITYNGFQNGENENILIAEPTTFIAADSLSHTGFYPVTLQAGNSDRYQFMYGSSTLHIIKAPLVVTCLDTNSVYGTTPVANGLLFSGLRGDDTRDSIQIWPSIQLNANSTSPCGQYTISPINGLDSNYYFNYVPGTLTITKAPLQIIPNDTVVEYGNFTGQGFSVGFNALGFVNNDSLNDLLQLPIQSTMASSQSPAGIYPIYSSGGWDENYFFLHDSSVLTITKAPLAIIAGNSQSAYGTAPILSPVKYQGFKNNDTVNELSGLPIVKTDADTFSTPGTYAVYFPTNSVSSLKYQPIFIPGTHTVTKKELQIKAIDTSIYFGTPVPALNYSVTGFVHGDSIGDLDMPIHLTTNCTDTSYCDQYTIDINPLSDDHYQISRESGKLTVLPVLPSVELLSVEVQKDILHCGLNLTESGGAIDDIGFQISRKDDQFISFLSLPLKDRNLLNPPFTINYQDSVELHIPNEEFLIRAYATNQAGTSYSDIWTIQHFRDDYLFILHQPGGSNLIILSGKAYQNGSMDLFSLDGKKIVTHTLDKARMSIPLSQLNTGIYFLRLYSPLLKRYTTERLLIR